MLSRFRSVARSLLRRGTVETDLDDEIRDHLDRDIADRIRRGADPVEARRAALADFGGVEGTREDLRDQAGISFLEELARDARFAARRVARSPRYALLVVLTVGLGIGAGTAVFSAVDGVLLKPLPFEDPDAIVTLWKTRPAEGVARDDLSPGLWRDLQERTSTLSGLAAANPYGVNISTNATTERVEAWQVSAEFFSVLRARPFLGRSFEPRDFQPGAPPVLILDHGFWLRRFGGDPSVVGSTLRVDGRAVTVAGVMPRDFDVPGPTDLWWPWVLREDERQDRFSAYVRVLGRLTPGVTMVQAQSELDDIAVALEREYPRSNTGVSFTALPLDEFIIGDRRPLLFTLLGAAMILLAVALANVAALHVTRLSRQQHETALRAMLGASGSQLVRPLVAEAVLLAILGGAAGLALGWAGVRALHAFGPADLPRLSMIAVDWRVAAAAVLLAAVAALLLSVLPLWHTGARASGNRSVAGHRLATRGRRMAVGAQVALGLVLLTGTALLARSFVRVLGAERGYRSDHLLSFTTWVYDEYPSGTRVPEHAVRFLTNPEARAQALRSLAVRAAFVQRVLEGLSALPGVETAAMGSALPMADEITGEQADVIPPGSAGLPGEDRPARGTVVWPGYFSTLGIALRGGRTFTAADDERAELVLIVNETFARRIFGGEDPVGRTVRVGLMGAPLERRIVGVVADTRHARLDAPPEPAVYIPWGQMPLASLTFVMRTSVDAGSLGPAVARLLYEIDPRVGIARLATMDALLGKRLGERRFLLVLLGAFAMAAVLIAAVGVFGVMSQAAAEREREIAVRMALGASPRTILGEFITEAGWITAIGMVVGLAIAAVVTRTLTRFLFQVTPLDALSLGAASGIVTALAFVAAVLPARRAARTDPAGALQGR